jgi:hypothetical protein
MSYNPMVRPDANVGMNNAMRGYPRTTTPQPTPPSQGTPGLDASKQTSAPGFTLHPPGVAASQNEYNYEPQADSSWKMYPPGVQAPANTLQASMPQAADTADLARMSQEISNIAGSSRTGV